VARRKSTVPGVGDLFEPEARGSDLPSGRPAPAEPGPGAVRAPPPPARRDSLYFDEPFREFEYSGGVHLADSILWCDADRRKDLCFLSHAHVDLMGKNRRLLVTDKTAKILTRGTGKIEALTSPYRRPFTLGPLELEMHPSGHVLGAAQLLIQRDGRRVVYTSDVNPRKTATAEQGTPVPCDVLAIPATYGAPMYRFPPREEVLHALTAFVERSLEDKATPVLFANPIGTAQELMSVLGKAGYRLRVHRAIYDVAKVYRELGLTLPNSRRFQGTPAKDEVVIFPPILRRHASVRKLRKPRTAVVSGRAVDPAWVHSQKVDAAFPLSDTADFKELLGFIEATGAREIYLVDGHIEPLSAHLRERLGVRVYSLVRPKQLALF
jgi:putative mRNA 3-end processing factor